MPGYRTSTQLTVLSSVMAHCARCTTPSLTYSEAVLSHASCDDSSMTCVGMTDHISDVFLACSLPRSSPRSRRGKPRRQGRRAGPISIGLRPGPKVPSQWPCLLISVGCYTEALYASLPFVKALYASLPSVCPAVAASMIRSHCCFNASFTHVHSK